MRLNIENITKSFGEKQVLKGISLSAEGGKAVGLLGRNGAGKTTTIRIVMGVFPADSGRVTYNGAPLRTDTTRVGYLPEERGLYPKLPIMEQLLYFAALRGMRAAEAKKEAKRLLARLGMEEYANRKLDTLSKGNQQKIQLVATLLCNPEIVILDEPFSGLDPVNAMLLEDLVKELIHDGRVVLFSSHQMNYIEEFCDEIAILNGGAIVLSGNIREIKRSYDRSGILLAGPEPDGIARFVRERCGAFVRETARQDDGRILVQLTDPGQKGALLAALAGQGLELDEFAVQEPTLNDIFVKYTEGAV
jgi:ABC-2 type transport system ATP-binding protein